MFRFSIVSVFIIFSFTPTKSNNISTAEPNVTHNQTGKFAKEVALETKIGKLANENETMANNSKQNFNKSENQTPIKQSKEPGIYKQHRELQKELKILKKEQNETDNYIYQFKSKVLVKKAIMDYEEIFDKLELRHAQPPFQLNETAINHTLECWNYDRLAERRRQRWKFYLKTPPYCNETFHRLTKRIKESKSCTVDEFSKALSILYKRVSFAVHLETIKTINFTAEYLSQYKKVNFVIALLLADYPETELIKKIFEDLKS